MDSQEGRQAMRREERLRLSKAGARPDYWPGLFRGSKSDPYHPRVAVEGLLASWASPYRVRYGKRGVASKGIFSRAESSATELLFTNWARSLQGSILTRAPSGKAEI